ncbi:MAG: methyltransferase domain-containing protein [Paracoccaceae bacterium]
MFCCTDSELALKARFDDVYKRTKIPVIQAIERRVCGCDYGGNSWTIRDHADTLISILKLRPQVKLIDLGAGTGWPGIYLAKKSGCSVALVDLPEIGLQLADQRAKEEGLDGRMFSKVADAADLPFADQSFDAISHSDLLCCLVRKRKVLQECRRIVSENGLMAFTVISITSGLESSAYDRALKNAPQFIETDTSYNDFLEATGWVTMDCHDLTSDYRDSCARQIDADLESGRELADLFGAEETALRLANWRSKLRAIDDGLFKRELFVCRAKELENPL